MFSSSVFSSSEVSKPSTGCPAATSVPSGAMKAILKSQTSGSCGGPSATLWTALRVPATSTPTTRSCRWTRAHSSSAAADGCRRTPRRRPGAAAAARARTAPDAASSRSSRGPRPQPRPSSSPASTTQTEASQGPRRTRGSSRFFLPWPARSRTTRGRAPVEIERGPRGEQSAPDLRPEHLDAHRHARAHPLHVHAVEPDLRPGRRAARGCRGDSLATAEISTTRPGKLSADRRRACRSPPSPARCGRRRRPRARPRRSSVDRSGRVATVIPTQIVVPLAELPPLPGMVGGEHDAVARRAQDQGLDGLLGLRGSLVASGAG